MRSMKAFAKKMVLLCLFPLAWLQRRSECRRGPIVLTYHRVQSARISGDPLTVSAEVFAKQIEFLAKHYCVVSIDTVVRAIQGTQSLPDRAVLITFDDGWGDNYEVAFPVLRRLNVPALIFLSTALIGTAAQFWWEILSAALMDEGSDWEIHFPAADLELPDSIRMQIDEILRTPVPTRNGKVSRLIESVKVLDSRSHAAVMSLVKVRSDGSARARRPVALSWEQVKEMSSSGIAFGSHGHTHRLLTTLTDEELGLELRSSKSIIEAHLNKVVDAIAYPNGNFDCRIAKMAGSEGYVVGFTCLSGPNNDDVDPLELRRIHVHEDASLGFAGRFSSLFFSVELFEVRQTVSRFLQRLGRSIRNRSVH